MEPRILFIAVVPDNYAPLGAGYLSAIHSFQLISHKHSILALTAWLREHGCDGGYVWVPDTGEKSLSVIIDKIRQYKPDAFGYSLTSEELLAHYRLIDQLKSRYPDIPVIVGGPHATHEPVHTLKNFPSIDFLGLGEGEITLTEWLNAIKSGAKISEFKKINGLAFRNGKGGIFITDAREKFRDINVLPDPAFDLIREPGAPGAEMNAFPLVSSYGCPFHCTFCAADHGSYRAIDPERMAGQIEKAIADYGVEYFAIRDSFWPPSRKWLERFCDEVERKKLKFKFHFETRAGTLNEKEFRRLKRLGLQAVAVGVESGDPFILKNIKKGITPEDAWETFDILNRVGIFSIAFFMVGNHGDTHESIRTSVKFMRELNPAMTTISTFRPFPGSESYTHVDPKDEYWWMQEKNVSICELSVEELDRLRADHHIRYPLRWAYISQHVLSRKVSREHREIAWKSVRVHLRRYLLGMSERNGPMRVLIHGTKSVLRRRHA